MKKFILIVSIVVVLIFFLEEAYFRLGWYVEVEPYTPVTTFVRTEGDQILMKKGGDYETFEIRGVNLGSGMPGEWSTDFAIDEESYLRWFRNIQEMGANTIRIYSVQQDTFYNAFYKYNKDNEDPLWLLHGVWVNDYVQNSHRDAYDPDFFENFLTDCRTMLDVIHGKRKIELGKMAAAGSGTYNKDISPWVIGYILGVEWDDLTVAYTNEKYRDLEGYTSYQGKYLYTEEASPFEVMLAQVGDKVIGYESERYETQKLVAFSNWPTTDPFTYPEDVAKFFLKCAKVDVEHIRCTEDFLSGQFASYHIYPYYPDYLEYVTDWSMLGIHDIKTFLDGGIFNTYRAYLSLVVSHHTIPVVISEFGVSTGRGMAQKDVNTNRNQGKMSEKEQGQALIDCYKDIKAAGCCGCCVFTWQDEWFKRTWNTMYAVNMKRNPYWSDYQTNEQYFGLLSFDPGKEKCVCYVDGDASEWGEADIVTENEGITLSMKYDERFIYFLLDGYTLQDGKLYLPIDTTPKTGSNYCENFGLRFDRGVDFLISLDGRENSRVMVQERYESLRANYSENVYGFNTYLRKNIPDKDSPKFVNIDMILRTQIMTLYVDQNKTAEVFETGKLKYGNANPESPDFDSLADFMEGDGFVEIKLPWQLLNFSDPSRMSIHDDYYEHYGVEYINISEMHVGVGDGKQTGRIPLAPFTLKGWENKVTWHERLKSSYYMLQECWKKTDD